MSTMRPQMPMTAPSLEWKISSFCNNSSCVSVARDGDAVLVRDTKQSTGPVLRFTVDEWNAFEAGMRSGEFTADSL